MVIFDLDGTLLNTLPDLANALNYTLRKFGMKEKSLDETKMLLGNGIDALVKKALGENVLGSEFAQMFGVFKAYYMEHIDDYTAPYEGIMPLLDELQARGVKTGIVSNKFDEGVKALRDKFFDKRISYAQGVSETINKKPAPDAVFSLIKTLKAEDEKNIYVGDSEVDILTAKNAGIPAISVSWGFRGREFLENIKAQYIIDYPREVLKYI